MEKEDKWEQRTEAYQAQQPKRKLRKKNEKKMRNPSKKASTKPEGRKTHTLQYTHTFIYIMAEETLQSAKRVFTRVDKYEASQNDG